MGNSNKFNKLVSSEQDSNSSAKTPNNCSTQFSIQLYNLAKTSENFIFSPASIYNALSMAAIGSEGESFQQFKHTLMFNSKEELANESSNIQSNLTAIDKGVTTQIVNKIFSEISQVREEYLSIMKKNFQSAIENVEFSKKTDQIRKEINNWVEQVTENKIKDLLKEGTLDSDTKMVLVNAVYFKGQWETSFPKEQTYEGQFHLISQGSGKIVQVKMMYQENKFSYYQSKGFQYVSIPYKGGNYSMEIFLPQKKIEDLEKQISLNFFNKCQSNAVNTKINLILPQFKIEGESLNLNNILTNLGLVHPFSDNANFSFMDPNNSIKISSVIHKAMIEVNEGGTVASASTAIEMTKGCAKIIPSVNCNHPFMFTIIHNPTNSLLFLGKVVNPHLS